MVAGPIEPRSEQSFRLCIECKKLDPDYVDWVFFNTEYKKPMNLVSKNIKSVGFADLLHIDKTSKITNEIFIQLNKFQDWDPFKHMISDSSTAISNKKIDKITYQTKKSIIDNAARQIVKGTFGYLLSEIQQQVLTGEEYSNQTMAYVPIVVTTANLKICVINPEDIDSSTGHISKEPSYEKTESIIYECPPPKSVRFPYPDFYGLSLEDKKAIMKWHVLILSPTGFVNFLKRLDSITLV